MHDDRARRRTRRPHLALADRRRGRGRRARGRGGAAPAHPRRGRRPGAGPRPARAGARGRPAPRPGPRPRAALRAARARQDHAGDDHRRRDERAAAADQRPRDHPRRRPRRDPLRAQRGRRALRRRDPPDVAAGRGDALHGDGGLPGRRRHRQGARRHRDPARDPAVHARRRHHPRRAAARAAARPVRLHRPPGVLRARTSSTASSTARPGCSASSSTDEGAAEIASRSRGTPAHRQPAAAPGPRLRPGARRRRRHPRRRAARRSTSTRSTSSGSTGSTGRSSTRCAAGSAAARSASRTLAVAVGEERETVEEVAEPFLVRNGFLARTPRGRVATPAAWQHLGLAAPRRRCSAAATHPLRATDSRVRGQSAVCDHPRLHFTRRSARSDAPHPISARREVSFVTELVTLLPWSASLCCSGSCSSGPPQRRQQGTRHACRRSLTVGDEVMLTSGIFGTVREADDDTSASRSPTA